MKIKTNTMNDEYEEFHINKFKSSSFTVIEGSSDYTLNILFRLTVDSIILLYKDALFIDCWNIFNPYEILGVLRSYNIRSNIEQRKILSRIHIVRAFTEYQLDTIVKGLDRAIKEWNPGILIISYLPILFYNNDSERLLGPLIRQIKTVTMSSDIITIATNFGNFYVDKILSSNADRVISIEKIKSRKRKKKNKDIVRIIEDGQTIERVSVPSGQTRFNEFE